jgi:hypothetical protein
VLSNSFRVPFAFALAAVLTTTGIAATSLLGRQEFLLSRGVPSDSLAQIPRCYKVLWGAVDSLYRPNRIEDGATHLPSYLRLESKAHVRTRWRQESWRVVTVADPNVDSATLRSEIQFAGWMTHGSDSIDVILEVFPMVLRLRFAENESPVQARIEIGWDAPGTQLAEGQLIRIACRSEEAYRATA